MSATIDDKVVEKIFELSKQVLQLTKKVDNLSVLLDYQPDKFPLSSLVQETGKTRQTIRSHLLNNFEPDKDFNNDGGKIFVSGKTFVSIKEYYANKSK